MSFKTILSIVCSLLSAAACVFVASVALIWYRGGHEWTVLGVEVTLSEWWKPWWYAVACLAVRGGICFRPPLPIEWASAAVARLGGKAGLRTEPTGFLGMDSGYAVWGALIGSVAGAFFAFHYFYLMPWLTVRLLAVPALAAASAAAHHLFYLAFEKSLSHPVVHPGWRRSFRFGIYFLLWGFLVHFALPHYDARLTEPIGLQALAGLAAGAATIVAWWLPAWRKKAFAAALVAILIAGVASDIAWSRKRMPDAERVIFITIDTVRADRLGCYGYGRPTSPNIDKVAAEGALFKWAFCPMGVTDPSHASMFTGQYPRTHGIKMPGVGRVSGMAPSLAEEFRDRGYKTAAITSRVLLDPVRLGVTGFEHVSVPELESSDAPEAFRRAANWLERNRGEDAFLWVHFFDPHQPFEPHSSLPERFIEKDLGPKGAQKWLKEGKRYTALEVKYRNDLYDEEIAFMDIWVGKLVELVESMGSTSPPLILIVADHGEIMGELQDTDFAFGFGHGGVLQNGVAHVPLMVKQEGVVRRGLEVGEVVEMVDLAPTVAELALGVDNFPGQGQSLMDALGMDAEGAPGEERPGGLAGGDTSSPAVTVPPGDAVLERRRYDNPPREFLKREQFVLVRWPYKLFFELDGDIELYDLVSDPGESQDLSEERPELVEELRAGIDAWRLAVPSVSSKERRLTPDELKRLRDLGYIQ